MKHYFIFAGEASGDLHGSQLIHSLRALENQSQFSGVGGPLMRKAGLQGLLVMEDFQVMGFSDVIKALPRLWKYFYQVLQDILNKKPEGVILIDYPGFNLRLAKALRRRGYKGKIIQYICPTVWAHGKKRIKTMVETLDLLLTIYPFEKAYFFDTPLKVEYVGNPLTENLKNWQYDSSWNGAIGIPCFDQLIALFPGSRPGETMRHFPLQLEAARLLKRQFPQAKFACSYVSSDHLLAMQNLAKKSDLKMNEDLFFVPSEFRYELMQSCLAALAKSGTVTLELALLKKPTLVIYELSNLNHFIAKYLMRLNLPYYCIVNILGKTEIFPEIIGSGLSVQNIAKTFQALCESMIQPEEISQKCQKIIDLLGEKKIHQAAASAIIELFK